VDIEFKNKISYSYKTKNIFNQTLLKLYFAVSCPAIGRGVHACKKPQRMRRRRRGREVMLRYNAEQE
jgi:hypothetical protein